MSEINKLAGLVNRPEWDNFMVWLTEKNQKAHEAMEVCHPDALKGFQAEVRLIKEILTLRKTVNTLNK